VWYLCVQICANMVARFFLVQIWCTVKEHYDIKKRLVPIWGHFLRYNLLVVFLIEFTCSWKDINQIMHVLLQILQVINVLNTYSNWEQFTLYELQVNPLNIPEFICTRACWAHHSWKFMYHRTCACYGLLIVVVQLWSCVTQPINSGCWTKPWVCCNHL
jgi:hypothetical protein